MVVIKLILVQFIHLRMHELKQKLFGLIVPGVKLRSILKTKTIGTKLFMMAITKTTAEQHMRKTFNKIG